MPIPVAELERSFITVDGDATLSELHAGLRQQDSSLRYVIVALLDGNYSVALLSEISGAVARLGPPALRMRLADLPPTATPASAVERTAIGFGAAERQRDRQPSRRLLVLEDGEPIGLLTNEVRGGSTGGLPFNLFGPDSDLSTEALWQQLIDRREPITCPVCGRQFTFYELDPKRRAYICPHCHSVLSQS